jgi:hypothetical protein
MDGEEGEEQAVARRRGARTGEARAFRDASAADFARTRDWSCGEEEDKAIARAESREIPVLNELALQNIRALTVMFCLTKYSLIPKMYRT